MAKRSAPGAGHRRKVVGLLDHEMQQPRVA
jgi:hypothetical protein